jgi:hypothetical protein
MNTQVFWIRLKNRINELSASSFFFEKVMVTFEDPQNKSILRENQISFCRKQLEKVNITIQ